MSYPNCENQLNEEETFWKINYKQKSVWLPSQQAMFLDFPLVPGVRDSHQIIEAFVPK